MSRPNAPRQILSKAIAQHQSGRLSEAAALYQQVLSIEPNNSLALHNLGVVAHHQRRHEDAIVLIGKAIKLEAGNPGYYYNLGLAHHALQRFDEAAAQYRRAVALKNDYAAAYFNLASALVPLGKFDEAAETYRHAIRLAPQIAEGHYNLADVLAQQGKLDEAEAAYRQALSIKPDFTPALNNLSRIVFEKGNAAEALALSLRSLASAETEEAKSLFVDYARHCSRAGRLLKPVDGLAPTLARAIRQHWLRPNDVVALASQALELDPVVGKCMQRAAAAWPDRLPEAELFGGEGIAAMAKNPLLISLLEAAPGSDRAMEKFVCAARATILERLSQPDSVTADMLGFYASVAIQCFINEYVFSADEKELARAEQARNELIKTLKGGAEVAPVLPVAVAAYFPLVGVPGAEKLLERKWPAALTRLFDRELREPLKERELARSIPRLTPIEDRVSRLVQEQYEENPYPRWVETMEAWGRPKQVDEYMRAQFPHAPLRALGKDKIDILIAGAGTGRQAIEIARQFPDARVLAVDLSVAALAYARRKSDELRIKNIEYGQADIVEIGALNRRFDVIYASGVLHHLADPFAGWRGLLEILAPNGLMNVGLYSERAREDVVAAQRFVAEKGYRPTAGDIRRSREEFERLPADSGLRNVMLLADFYSMSDLRDLLFHVQEHRMSLRQIAQFLAGHKLQFLGFDQAPHILQRYQQEFPADTAMTDLALWERFEQENPRAFIGMYQFWVQKAGE
ncbi:MAG TPA: tetratricopeptide repeat protein [Xanthobacteraceae bacterium]|nr:tetratricopeptide repeat protein [Xanthobacteraceae bacterium]